MFQELSHFQHVHIGRFGRIIYLFCRGSAYFTFDSFKKVVFFLPPFIRQLEQEIKGLEESVTGRSRGLTKKAISEFCNVCFKVKVASTAMLICANCRKKTCLRCGKRDQVRAIIYNSSILGLTITTLF